MSMSSLTYSAQDTHSRNRHPLETAEFITPDGEYTHIVVRGAREHNLKNVNIEIPREKLVVITGLSGSGKSSLAFDTLYAEGQRRYVESLSAYARQFLETMEKPDVDTIEGLSPAISIEQKTVGSNPRSTVGTVTEVYDYLRLLYAKVGTQYCVDHPHIPVKQQTFDQIIDTMMTRFAEQRAIMLAPLVRARKGHYRELFEQLRKQGFTRVRVDGTLQDIVEGMNVERYQIHTIDVVIDRLVISADIEQRLRDSATLAMKYGENIFILLVEDQHLSTSSDSDQAHAVQFSEHYFSREAVCPECKRGYEALAPNNFSFNSPSGSCPSCEGLGETRAFSDDMMIPDKTLSLRQGGLVPLGKYRDTWLWKQVESVCEHYAISLDAPIHDIPDTIIQILLRGDKGRTHNVSYKFSTGNDVVYKQKFHGVLENVQAQYQSTSSAGIRAQIESFMSTMPCPACHGGRLRPESLNVRVGGKTIADITQMSVTEAHHFYQSLTLTDRELKIAFLILKEITSRLSFLQEVGLQYLTLNRTARTLSGGEGQRIRLASQIGSNLTGVMYVLDEPSIGLHQHDNRKLIGSLKRLRDLGNTVIVVEHDREMIEEADYLFDLGPGAGVHGGHLVLDTQPQKIFTDSHFYALGESVTFAYLKNERTIAIPETRRKGNDKRIVLTGAKGNNLKNVTLTIPLGMLTCITGMSGSGKSTLINDTLYPILSKHFFDSLMPPMPYASIHGLEHIDKVIEIDQAPIGRTPRSNPATYTGLFTLIRDLFTELPESKIRGYKAGRFSFNVPGGRCSACEGDGVKKIEMNFLPDVYVTCDVCNGKRYNAETLQVLFKNKSISDVLDMSVSEAMEFFKDIPKIYRKISSLYEVGLTYIKLGQQATTLSGGEAQRVKLATELSKTSTGKTMYILDEPTTGLHFEDVRILLELLHKLVDRGNTVVVIEHNLDVVKTADYVVDLGPEGGKGGGEIIAEGTPEEICSIPQSLTGQYLKEELERFSTKK